MHDLQIHAVSLTLPSQQMSPSFQDQGPEPVRDNAWFRPQN